MNTNVYTNKRIEFHIVQSFPVTCLNRDDVGSPKTAKVGGVIRARVSSQCWKRAIRVAMHGISSIELGKRTKCISSVVAQECKKCGATDEQAESCGKFIGDIFGEKDDGRTETLLFFSPGEVKYIAAKMREADFIPEKVTFEDGKGKVKTLKDEKTLAELLSKKVIEHGIDGLDVALFGRMVAQAPTMDIEASASFSHAISTHQISNEVEFFTALDDFSDKQGSAHMGTIEYNAATYYRYVCIDLGQLYETLGSDEFFDKAIESFIKALYVAIPQARQATQSGASSWDYAKIFVRKGQRLQLSCDAPVVKDRDGGFVKPSIEYVKNELSKKEKLSGSLFGKIAEYDFGDDESFNIDCLISEIIKSIKA